VRRADVAREGEQLAAVQIDDEPTSHLRLDVNAAGANLIRT
jgi:hypothetical protein